MSKSKAKIKALEASQAGKSDRRQAVEFIKEEMKNAVAGKRDRKVQEVIKTGLSKAKRSGIDM